MAPLSFTVLAHNEQRRIAACLTGLLAERDNAPINVVVNGATDRTAAIARSFGAPVLVHDYAQGGKSRSWNRFVLDPARTYADVEVFVDGDAEVCPGSIDALTAALAGHSHANAASAPPANGRAVERYRAQMLREHGLFGDLYALRGSFLERMRSAAIRLPDDLIGDDGLIGALAKTDLRDERHWDDTRVVVCPDAGFLCEPVSLANTRSWAMHYKRHVNYSVRHFQNLMISKIMRGPGPTALPVRLSDRYADELADAQPRRTFPAAWFDRVALARMTTSAVVGGA